jgi:hypothetical protein
VVQAGIGETRLSNIPTFQQFKDRKVCQETYYSYKGTTEGQKSYLESILKYIIDRLSTLSSQGWGHLLGRHYYNLLGGSPYTLPYLWSGRDVNTHFLILNTHQTPMYVKKCGLGGS